MNKQVMIVGGGASGLAAAVAAARAGAKVTILERLPRVGKKILLTGNGRCNLGNRQRDDSHYHGTLPQAKHILQQFDTEEFFHQLGLFTRTDSEGRMYPCSNAAASVLDALRMECDRLSVSIRTEEQVTDLQQMDGRWQITTKNAKYHADAVVLATGGSAAPACGTDGNLLPLLKRMGYTILQPMPALCPIPSDAQMLKPLKGIRVRATATALIDGNPRKTEVGEVQFTETALSGICLFNLSRLAAVYGNRMNISLCLLPEELSGQQEQLMDTLLQTRGDVSCADLLTGLLPKRVAEVLVKQALGKTNGSAREILNTPEAKSKLMRILSDWQFPVTGTATFAQAQVTAGGISGQCVTQALMSKKHAGLYFCGELLDIDGDCGGYNLDWAWASGACAGRHAASDFSLARSIVQR